MEVNLTRFDQKFLDYSWYWLNDKEIKKLVSVDSITRESQLKWYNSIKNRVDYLIWGLEVEGFAIGVSGIKNITKNDCEYWGYIGEKDYWGKGLGTQIMVLMEKEAKSRRISSIWLQVNVDNVRAIGLYEKMNYKIEKEIEGKLLMRKII